MKNERRKKGLLTSLHKVLDVQQQMLDWQAERDLAVQPAALVQEQAAKEKSSLDGGCPVPGARPAPRARGGSLGVWLVRQFVRFDVTGLTLAVQTPGDPSFDESLDPIASWDREDFEKYIGTPEWFAPVIKEAAARHVAQAPTRYVVLAYRNGRRKPYARFSFRIIGTADEPDIVENERPAPGETGAKTKKSISVPQVVLRLVQQHQQDLLGLHARFMTELSAVMEQADSKSRSTT